MPQSILHNLKTGKGVYPVEKESLNEIPNQMWNILLPLV